MDFLYLLMYLNSVIITKKNVSILITDQINMSEILMREHFILENRISKNTELFCLQLNNAIANIQSITLNWKIKL